MKVENKNKKLILLDQQSKICPYAFNWIGRQQSALVDETVDEAANKAIDKAVDNAMDESRGQIGRQSRGQSS